MRPPPRFFVAATAGTVILATLVGCGGGTDAACGPIRREALDSGYLVHVLDLDPAATAALKYSSDPPTSGPHQPTPPIGGVVEEPLPRPVQVGVLERGDVLLQYLPSIPAAQLDVLRELAGEHVTVAPNPSLPKPVIATAWVFKRSCSAADRADLREFIDARVGKGP